MTGALAVAVALPAVLPAQQRVLPSAAAQVPRGLFYHGHVEGTQFRPKGGVTDYGVGAGFQIGYNVTRHFGLFVGLDHARTSTEPANFSSLEFGADDHFAFTHAEVGARLNVPLARRLLPYVDLAYARRAFALDFQATPADGAPFSGNIEASGDHLVAGGGVQLFLRRTVALDLGARVSAGELSRMRLMTGAGSFQGRDDEALDVTFSRLTGGLTWYFPKFHPGI